MSCVSPSLLSWEGSWGAINRLEMCQQSFQLGSGVQGKAGRRWEFTAGPKENSHQQQMCSGLGHRGISPLLCPNSTFISCLGPKRRDRGRKSHKRRLGELRISISTPGDSLPHHRHFSPFSFHTNPPELLKERGEMFLGRHPATQAGKVQPAPSRSQSRERREERGQRNSGVSGGGNLLSASGWES